MKKLVAVAVALLVSGTAVSKAPKPAAEPEPAAEESATATPAAQPAAVAEYRHTVMEGVGKHMGASVMILKGEVSRPGDLVAHAEAMHDVSRYFGELFPEGTGPDQAPETDALATIWSDRAGFEAALSAFQEESKKLVEVAKAGDMAAYGEQFKKVGGACKGCHDDFRADEE